MNKNFLSIVIILLAVAIVIVNLWNPLRSSDKKDITNRGNAPVSQESDDSKKTLGTDLSEVQEGNPAPDFELTTLKGETVKLSDYKGKKVILNFWATWCPPCKAEMPHMQKFYEENKNKNIEILAINLTSMDKGDSEIRKFVNNYGLTFKVLLDSEGTIGSQYQAYSIPTSYILDSNGIITKKIVGPMDEDMMIELTKNAK
ncbi:TlpA family protein disulfide reductase [Priestia filamentosa]|uniref:peroxiredoxin family protein n=1 Tax=Priestia filamentosa TaxID=1402861 RepID=UPI003F14BFDE